MKPSFSVIFFTVVSGCGYGLLFLFGIALTCDPMLFSRGEALVLLGVGAAFVIAGLLSSTLHLGQPQRAWRAFSQWRSSWLSREGVASLASFAPILVLAWWLWRGADPSLLRGGGIALTALAAITVICTAKIYSSLKTIPAWHNDYVLPGYLLLGLLGGAAWMWPLNSLPPHWTNGTQNAILPCLVALVALAAALLKRAYWKSIDAAPPVATTESATGLGRFGAVRSVEAPHTEENYLTHEMGFVLARKHGARLRRIALILFGAVPVLLAIATMFASVSWGAFCAVAAALAVSAGLFVERWLFFAQAKHVVMLYYGDTQK